MPPSFVFSLTLSSGWAQLHQASLTPTVPLSSTRLSSISERHLYCWREHKKEGGCWRAFCRLKLTGLCENKLENWVHGAFSQEEEKFTALIFTDTVSQLLCSQGPEWQPQLNMCCWSMWAACYVWVVLNQLHAKHVTSVPSDSWHRNYRATFICKVSDGRRGMNCLNQYYYIGWNSAVG